MSTGHGRETEALGCASHPLISLGFLLNKAAQILLDDFERELRPYDLTAREFGVLRYIDLNGGQSQQSIGANLRIDRTTMVAVVDVLERQGLVDRVRDAGDRRRYAITLTDRGREHLHRDLVSIEQRVTDQFLAGLDVSDRRRLVDILGQLVCHQRNATRTLDRSRGKLTTPGTEAAAPPVGTQPRRDTVPS